MPSVLFNRWKALNLEILVLPLYSSTQLDFKPWKRNLHLHVQLRYIVNFTNRRGIIKVQPHA